MADHPIQGLMKTAMESIKDMVDVNTIVGDAVETQDGSVIVPVSRVSFGFAAGGGEYGAGGKPNDQDGADLGFAGGSGGGVSIQPVGFLVVSKDQIRLLPVDNRAVVDRLLDVAPNLVSELKDAFGRKKGAGEEPGSAEEKKPKEYRV
ncbi:MAG: GerW family sporulation protein [Bacillota bacterium]